MSPKQHPIPTTNYDDIYTYMSPKQHPIPTTNYDELFEKAWRGAQVCEFRWATVGLGFGL